MITCVQSNGPAGWAGQIRRSQSGSGSCDIWPQFWWELRHFFINIGPMRAAGDTAPLTKLGDARSGSLLIKTTMATPTPTGLGSTSI